MTNPDVDSISWLRVGMAFAVVTALMGLLGFALKQITTRGLRLPGLRTPSKRLQLVESLPLDVRRRLVIVRCDDAEHLLLLGINQDIVVETHLKKNHNRDALAPQSNT